MFHFTFYILLVQIQKYCYSGDAMNVRTALACIDQNTNCNRSQKLLLSGEPAYDVKVLHAQDSFVIKAQVDRSRKKEVAVKRKEDKDYSFRDEVNSFFIPLLFLQFFLQASLRDVLRKNDFMWEFFPRGQTPPTPPVWERPCFLRFILCFKAS